MKKKIGMLFLLLNIVFWAAPWRVVLGQSQHDIKITWTYSQGTDAAVGFNVYRSATTGGPYVKQNSTTLTLTTLAYTDISGNANTKYFYVVRAVDAIGIESVNSSEVNATMLGAPNPPTGVQAVAE